MRINKSSQTSQQNVRVSTQGSSTVTPYYNKGSFKNYFKRKKKILMPGLYRQDFDLSDMQYSPRCGDFVKSSLTWGYSAARVLTTTLENCFSSILRGRTSCLLFPKVSKPNKSELPEKEYVYKIKASSFFITKLKWCTVALCHYY